MILKSAINYGPSQIQEGEASSLERDMVGGLGVERS
jgi:hypothetical protein